MCKNLSLINEDRGEDKDQSLSAKHYALIKISSDDYILHLAHRFCKKLFLSVPVNTPSNNGRAGLG